VGVIGRMGNIAQGTTVSDYHVSEKQHQISALTLRVGSFG
jgi:elongation factor G